MKHAVIGLSLNKFLGNYPSMIIKDFSFQKSCIHFYNEFWKRRCAVLHNAEVQLKVLKEEVEVTMEEANAEEIEGLSRNVKSY